MAARLKVLLTGPNFMEFNTSIARGFEGLGCETRIVCFDDPPSPGWIHRGVVRIARSRLQPFLHHRERLFNAHFTRVYQDLKPDLVLVLDGHNLYPQTLEGMRGALRAIWFYDVVERCPRGLENAQASDHVFVFERSDLSRLEALGVKANFLPMAFDPTVHVPRPGSEKDIDVVFVGNLYESRCRLLERFVQELPHLKIRIFGKYLLYTQPATWIRALRYAGLGYTRHFHNGFLKPDAVNLLYARSHIALNMHRTASEMNCNPRVFEIAGAGAFQLVDFKPGIVEAFGDTVATYADYAELKEKVKEYLADGERRARMALAARRIALAGHTYQHRAASILEVTGLTARPWT